MAQEQISPVVKQKANRKPYARIIKGRQFPGSSPLSSDIIPMAQDQIPPVLKVKRAGRKIIRAPRKSNSEKTSNSTAQLGSMP